ncbi:hypothetical protein F511_41041 [Dorcoceras hygrometricum]|uniref:FAF domain-containing protein n=1 Tax=Dorcoceras hygrometricum TaxID=472368 RepID=A0A2Z7C9E1_9LAMI|nr:hypothetical protein F511_41041 [Dorcoceras hygrometricum]
MQMGDYIGMESCVDLKPDVELSHSGATNPLRSGGRRGEADKEYPPRIPSLAGTEQLPSWVMHKHYSGDGRLIITEEKVRRHEYLQAHRSDGRLTLDLVPSDSDDAVEGAEEEISGGGDEETDDSTVVESGKCNKNVGVKVKPGGGFGVHVVPFSRSVHNA